MTLMMSVATDAYDDADEGCTWVVGLYYGASPPEPCGREVAPNAEYCAQHQAAEDAFDRMQQEYPEEDAR